MFDTPESIGFRAPQRGPGSSLQAPSRLLALGFVVTGVLSLAAGVAWLVWRPELLSTYHYNQYVIAVTHLWVLGWITTMVIGAMYQLAPVVLGTRLHSEGLARWQFAFHVLGFAGMVWMFWVWNLKQVGHFGSVLAVGVGLFVYNLARTLWRVPRWTLVASAVASALVWLSLAILAGLTIAAGKCSYESVGVLPANQPLGALVRGLKAVALFAARFDAISAMHAHAHLGGVGVFLMLLVGISGKLLPMFTLSEVQSPRRLGLAIALLNAGVAASFVAILLRSPWKFEAAGLIVGGVALYGMELGAILRARKRRTLDWGLKHFLTGVALLLPVCGLALVLSWPTLPLTERTGRLENLYGFLALAGVVSLAIVGMLYKIVPLFVWHRSCGPGMDLEKLPSPAELCSPLVQAAGYWTYVSALLGTSFGILLGNAATVRVGCGLFALSLLALGLNLVEILSQLRRPAPGKTAAVRACGIHAATSTP